MSRFMRAAGLAATLLALTAISAVAHEGDPNFRSVVRVVPEVSGLQVQVLDYDDELQVTNHSGQPVVIYGYSHDPYLRLLGDGTVQTNLRSPATYLNQEQPKAVPPSAKLGLAPQWKTLDRASTFAWHDHRIRLQKKGTPPQVKDKSKRTKVLDYSVPITVGAQQGALDGTLYWAGSGSSSDFPVAAVVSLVAVALLAVAIVVVVRRRRESDSASTSPSTDQ
jgi:hypothetical protein